MQTKIRFICEQKLEKAGLVSYRLNVSPDQTDSKGNLQDIPPNGILELTNMDPLLIFIPGQSYTVVIEGEA